jgi:hypothetical protein
MSRYEKIKARVDDALRRQGQLVTLRKPGAMIGAGHAREPGAPTTHTVRAVEIDGRFMSKSGTLIEGQKRMVLISAAGTAPERQDEIEIGGAWLRLGEVAQIAPAGSVVLWQAEVIS